MNQVLPPGAREQDGGLLESGFLILGRGGGADLLDGGAELAPLVPVPLIGGPGLPQLLLGGLDARHGRPLVQNARNQPKAGWQEAVKLEGEGYNVKRERGFRGWGRGLHYRPDMPRAAA